MRKAFNIFLAALITLFSFPIGGLSVSAEENDRVTPDKAYEINYTILHEDGNSSSVADGFFQKPGTVLEYDEKTYFQLTVESAEMVQALSNKYGDYVLVAEKDGTKTMQLRVPNDLSNMKLDMHIIVPAGSIPGFPGYDEEHGAILTFDRDSKESKSVENYNLVTSEGENGPSAEVTEPDEGKDEDHNGDSSNDGSEEGSNEEDGKGESEDTESGEGSDEDSGDIEGEESEDETTEVEPLADGTYELSYTTEGADLSRYYEDKAIVIVDGDQQYLQLQGKSMRQFIEYLYIDGNRMDVSAATNEAGAYIAQFEMDEKVEENAPLAFDMVINAMGRIMVHGSKITLDLSSTENIDSAELIEGVPSAENETFVTSTDSVAYEYDSGDVDLSSYYEDTINVLEKDGKQYIEFKGTEMANFIEALYVDGKKMAIEQNEDGSYIAQVEHEESLREKFNFTMIINDRGQIMSHSANIELIIPEETIEINSGDEERVSGNQTLVISNDKNDEKITIKTPPSLPDDTKITVEIIDEEDQDVQSAKESDFEVAGSIVDVTLDMSSNLKYDETFTLTLPYDAETYDEDNYYINIYHFDEEKQEWVALDGKVENGQVTTEVEHFSKYGVFAKKKSEDTDEEGTNGGEGTEDDEDDETDSGKGEGDDEKKSLTPDKAYEINYTILHEDGNAPSVADGFFQKPGTVLEYDRKTYFQMTVESADMIKALSNEYGDYLTVVDHEDGSRTMQLRVPNDLSDMKLDMHIVVPAGAIPGFPGYDEEHGAILTFDQDSRKNISVEGLEVAASDDKDNENGPFEEDAKTPPSTPTDPEDETNGKGNGQGNGKGKGKGEGDDDKKSFKPEKAYEINYTILQENGNSVSVADGFFQKPGILLEYKGKTYLQMTVESSEMVKSLSNKYGDYILVSKNEDGTMTIQLRVPNDLSDMKLDMHIVVPAGAIPGFPGYDEKHGAILTFDKDSKKEISVEGLEVAASGDKNNQNGPYSPNASPSKPNGFGDNGDDDSKGGKGKDGDNPKTGDPTQIWLYTMLLIGSLIPLAIKARRKFA